MKLVKESLNEFGKGLDTPVRTLFPTPITVGTLITQKHPRYKDRDVEVVTYVYDNTDLNTEYVGTINKDNIFLPKTWNYWSGFQLDKVEKLNMQERTIAENTMETNADLNRFFDELEEHHGFKINM